MDFRIAFENFTSNLTILPLYIFVTDRPNKTRCSNVCQTSVFIAKKFRRARHRSASRSPSQEENEDRKQTRNDRVSLQRSCGSQQLPWPLKLRSSLSISPGKKLRRDLDLSETLSLDHSRVSTNFPGSFEVPNETDCSDIPIKINTPIQYRLFVRLGLSERKDNSLKEKQCDFKLRGIITRASLVSPFFYVCNNIVW